MKKISSLSALPLAAFALLAMSQNTHAAVIAEDDFTYADGNLAGNGSGTDLGWADSWQLVSGAGPQVSGNTVSASGGTRGNRLLDTSIGGASDFGLTYEISLDIQLGEFFNGFEAHNGGNSDGNRVFVLGANISSSDDNQRLEIGSGIFDFTDNTVDVRNFRTVITFGATGADQDTAELFVDSLSLGTMNIGTDFEFDRVGFAAFGGGASLSNADNLVISTIPEPSTLGLIIGAGMAAVVLRRRRR